MRQKLDILLKEAIISLILCIILFILMILNWKIGAVVLLFQIYRVFDIMIKNSSFNEDETRAYIRMTGAIVSIIIFIIMLWKQKRKLGFLFFLFYRIISSFTPRHTSQNPPNSLQTSQKSSLFFNCFYHILATSRVVFTISVSSIFSPKTMIWR